MNNSKSNQDERITQLFEEFNFKPLTAKVYIKDNGKCAYCGLDLLETDLEYYSGVIDRILPKIKYPELEWEEDNLVLSCYSCSNIKEDFDVLEVIKTAEKNALEALKKCKPLLLNGITSELSNRAQTIENERIRVKQIIRGQSG